MSIFGKGTVTVTIWLMWLLLVCLDVVLCSVVILYSVFIGLPIKLLKKCGLLSNCCKSGKNESECHCVIIGYSFGGMCIHHQLQSDTTFSNWKFTVIEPKSYFEFTPSILECIVKSSKFESISVSLSKVFNPTRYLNT